MRRGSADTHSHQNFAELNVWGESEAPDGPDLLAAYAVAVEQSAREPEAVKCMAGSNEHW